VLHAPDIAPGIFRIPVADPGLQYGFLAASVYLSVRMLIRQIIMA
jgi:hypothetical protein